jgi:hypothetical protein
MKLLSFVLLLAPLVFAIDKASAQSPISSLESLTYTDKVPPVQKGNRSFTIEPSYVLSEMIAGRRDARLTITITAPSSGSGFLGLKGVPVITSQDAHDKFEFTSNGSEDSEGVVHTRKYHFIVRIDDQTEPRRHQVRVAFVLPDESEKSETLRYFDLNVGVKSDGKLAPVPPAEDSQSPSFETGFFGREEHTYQLNLQNSFPDYTVSIESIKIHSDPAGLIVPKEFVYENGISLTPGEHATIQLDFETTTLGFKNLISSLATKPRLQADIFYNDGNGRRITDLKPRFAINIPPTNQTLMGSVVLGLLLGAVIRTVLEFMLFKKQISSKGVLKLISYSLLFGLLLVVLVIVGQIEIKTKTLSMSSSYENPLVMFSVGLIGALAGLQLVIGWYKSLRSD